MGQQGVGQNEGRVFCARADYDPREPKDACSGDSGGPVYSSENKNSYSDLRYLRGIVSIGSTKCGSVSLNVTVVLLQSWCQ